VEKVTRSVMLQWHWSHVLICCASTICSNKTSLFAHPKTGFVVFAIGSNGPKGLSFEAAASCCQD